MIHQCHPGAAEPAQSSAVRHRPYIHTGQLYFINQTDLIISNSPSGIISAYFQDSNNVTPVKYDTPQRNENHHQRLHRYNQHSYSFATNTIVLRLP